MAARRGQAGGMAIDLLANLCPHLVLLPGMLLMSEVLLTMIGSSCRSSANIPTPGTVHQRTASFTLSDQMRDISSSL